jgi:hypothetical protein
VKTREVHKRTASDLRPDVKILGDTLNILLIINKDFQVAAENVFNPRNSMYISKNDGMFNNSYNHKRDTIINMNTFVQLSRSNYSQEQLNRIKQLQEMR